jgi:hypothetical protein
MEKLFAVQLPSTIFSSPCDPIISLKIIKINFLIKLFFEFLSIFSCLVEVYPNRDAAV